MILQHELDAGMITTAQYEKELELIKLITDARIYGIRKSVADKQTVLSADRQKEIAAEKKKKNYMRSYE